MEFNCNVRIVDEIMGRGKSVSAINYINSFDNDMKFIVITPYLDEIERYKTCCKDKHFKQPMYRSSTKFDDLKRLVNNGENIIATHSLFQKFDNELINMCRASDYTLIMDEVANVASEYEISEDDFNILKRDFVDIDEEYGLIKWKNAQKDYKGEFSEIKRLCDLGSLAYYSGSIMMWLFPVEAFNSFRNIFILTYMFNAQIQRYYYDFYKLPYKYMYVSGNSLDTYQFSETRDIEYTDMDYSKLIHVVDNVKLNKIGDTKYDLSKAWYKRNQDNIAMKQLRNNMTNFFKNITHGSTKDNLWTTFKEYKPKLQGKGYTKGFLALNTRATNEYRDRTNVAYPVNRYTNPILNNFFRKRNVDIDEDGYALSEMLQFIWRSAIRDKKEIWVYVPSIRMRKLLQDWIKENSNIK